MASVKKKEILVVDDSLTALMHIVRELSQEFDVVTASSGREALNRIATSQPDAIVTDLEMGEMRGTELLRQLKAEPTTQNIPVIVVTTVTAVDEMNICRTLGCAGFVLKPVDGGYLRVKLKRLFAKPA